MSISLIRSFKSLSIWSKILLLIGLGIALKLMISQTLDFPYSSNFYLFSTEGEETTFKTDIMMRASADLVGRQNLSCHCMEQENTTGRCSNAALNLGPGQKVISYSLYGPRDDYEKYLDRRLAQVRKWYPGWVMRVYSDWEIEEGEDICEFVCNNPSDVFWCDVRKMKESKKIMKAFGMTWRLVPIDDPLVDTFLSRDLDGHILQREREAVTQWENSNYVFHFMRDHEYHLTHILGGMWGAKVHLLREEDRRDIYRNLLMFTWKSHKKGADQQALTNVIYRPKYWNMSMAHDPYYCKVYARTLCIDFPSPRNGDEFVPMNNDCDASHAFYEFSIDKAQLKTAFIRPEVLPYINRFPCAE